MLGAQCFQTSQFGRISSTQQCQHHRIYKVTVSHKLCFRQAPCFIQKALRFLPLPAPNSTGPSHTKNDERNIVNYYAAMLLPRPHMHYALNASLRKKTSRENGVQIRCSAILIHSPIADSPRVVNLFATRSVFSTAGSFGHLCPFSHQQRVN